ncbi:hypothetical protein D3C80_2044850 [compost metagenome]
MAVGEVGYGFVAQYFAFVILQQEKFRLVVEAQRLGAVLDVILIAQFLKTGGSTFDGRPALGIMAEC